MNNTDKNMLIAALSQKDVYPKALANFMFREIIEDAHSKYNISQEDMKAMNKEAVNRAMLFLTIKSDPDMYRAFAIEALGCEEWDESEMTEELYDRMAKMMKMFKELSE
ncbi:MAG: hypothetical protein EOM00_13615 [Clostridia bacterium]|nr:hypothetical protein [Clostridia bacterium]